MLFAPAVTHGFIRFDDPDYVFNPVVRRGLTFQGLWWAVSTITVSNWHPLTWASHMLDWSLFGDAAWGHHLVNVLLHAAAAAVAFLILEEATSDRPRALAVAALFAWHPLRVESVAWVAERKDLLCTLFYLGACWAHVRWARRGAYGFPGWVVLLAALAFLSKPMAVTLPFALLLLDLWPLRRAGSDGTPLTRLVREKAALLAMTVGTAALTLIGQVGGGAAQDLEQLPLTGRLGGALVGGARYLALTAWPSGLGPFYPLPPHGWSGWAVATSALLLAAITALAWSFRRRVPAALVGWLWFLGVLVPVIGLFQVGDQSVADRYTYLPHFGLWMAAVWLCPIPRSARARRALAVAIAGLAGTFAVLTVRQLGFWKDDQTLFTHLAEVSPNNYIAEAALGSVLFDQGRAGEAEQHLRRAVALKPGYPPTHTILGRDLLAQTRVEEGLREMSIGSSLAVEHPQLNASYAHALATHGHQQEAIPVFREVLALDPDYPGAALELGQLLGEQGRYREAISVLEQALRRTPKDADLHCALGVTLARAGQFPAAVQEFDRTLMLNPQDPHARPMRERAHQFAHLANDGAP